MISIRYIFVVLVYKNTEDIRSFILSVRKTVRDYRIIIVNSFSDQETTNILAKISHEEDCDFIRCENNGYGYGNNIGIRYAQEHYEYQYIIVSNPDVEILNFPENLPKDTEKCLCGPSIQNLQYKPQNPYLIHNCKLRNFAMRRGFKEKSKFMLSLGHFISRTDKIIFLIVRYISQKKISQVFAIHGSFLIFPFYVIKELYPVFDEKIFLFSEEFDIALKAQKKKIPVIFVPEIKILHKEDGSMKYEDNTRLAKIERESFLYVYNKWIEQAY